MKKKEKSSGKKIFAVVFVLLTVAGLCGVMAYDAIKSSNAQISSVAMGTVVSIKLNGYGSDKAAQQIVDRINDLDNRFLTCKTSDSDVGRINAGAGSTVNIDGFTAGILTKSNEICAAGDGAFDITLGSLTSLWDIGGENQRVPLHSEIEKALDFTGYKNLVINGNTAGVPTGFSLDLGAVGKGVACDEARTILLDTKVKNAIISVGGSVLLFGENEDGSPFRVGIRDPRGDSGEYMGILKLNSSCVSTSGDYEKYFTSADGSVYHHILNPETGYPVRRDLISVTVCSDSGLVSDALSTACFVLGYEKSLPLLEKYSAQAVFITTDKKVIVTDGIADSFELTNSDKYTLEQNDNA